MAKPIPAKDVAGMIWNELKASVRKVYGPDASPEELNNAELAILHALGGAKPTAKKK